LRLFFFMSGPLTGFFVSSHADEPARPAIPISRPAQSHTVDFDREILPILRADCLPCHNKTTSKADLLLETPADMLKGGESGAAIVPGKAMSSLMLRVAAHQEKPRMPPKDNKVNAVNLTPEELGVLALWIDQGAKASPKREEVIAWQSLPENLNPILAVAASGNGRYVACGRGNRVDVYRLLRGEHLTRLADPALSHSNNAAPTAHRDEVNALALSADGDWLASGGFREVKLWKRHFNIRATAAHGPLSTNAAALLSISPDGKFAVEIVHGKALLSDAEARRFVVALNIDIDASAASAAAERVTARLRSETDHRKTAVETAGKERDNQLDRLKKAVEAHAVAGKAASEKEASLELARRAATDAEIAVMKTTWLTVRPLPNADQKKAAADKLQEAKKKVEKEGNELKPLRQKLDAAANELDLANHAVDRAEAVLLSAQWQLDRATRDLTAAMQAGDVATASARRTVPQATAATFSSDGQFVATAHVDGKIRLWIPSDGTPVDTILVDAEVRALFPGDSASLDILTSSGKWLSIGIRPEWTLEHKIGSEAMNTPFADRVTALAFRPDGRRLAAGSGEPTRSGDVTIWDPASAALLYSLPALHSDTVLTLAYSPDGWLLASGGADRFARIVDTALNRQVRALEGHTGHVLGVAWSPDGRSLATAGADLAVKLWDPLTGEKRKQATGFTREVTAVGFTENSQRFVAASGENELRVLNESGEKVQSLKGPTDFTYALSVTSDGKWIIAGGQDGTLRAWKNGSETPDWQLREADPGVALNHR
jgi:WD40 repeat protein